MAGETDHPRAVGLQFGFGIEFSEILAGFYECNVVGYVGVRLFVAVHQEGLEEEAGGAGAGDDYAADFALGWFAHGLCNVVVSETMFLLGDL